ncbi:ABC transporter substrate-binding protein [Roseococcus sp. DSY-14]|uniref:ABC transporter substrate-binding protein n=1 Tax=Roseococcus sp. DSY-14 TaxID=3369650 RepID=UPI00387B644D
MWKWVMAGMLAGGMAAQAQPSDRAVRIGVLADMSGVFADIQGPGDVVAARMAIEDHGGRAAGAPVELVSGDGQNRTDIGVAMARRWFDNERVDAIFGLNNSAIALGIQALGAERNRITIATSVGTTDLTGRACAATGVHWVYDNFALAAGTANAVVDAGGRDWFFITSDYAFGHSLEANAAAVVRERGGRVLGSVRVPLGSTDFASALAQAAGSRAQVLGIAAAGADFQNIVKQASEFGLQRRGLRPAALLALITDIRSLGSEAAQGLVFTEAFYWDQTDDTRAFAARFQARHGRPPTMFQAGTYSAVRHYLKAVDAAGTDEAGAVMERMRAIPVEDFMTRGGTIREDGRMMRDMYLMRALPPAQVRGEWGLLEVVSTIPAERAFRPLAQSECPRVRR